MAVKRHALLAFVHYTLRCSSSPSTRGSAQYASYEMTYESRLTHPWLLKTHIPSPPNSKAILATLMCQVLEILRFEVMAIDIFADNQSIAPQLRD